MSGVAEACRRPRHGGVGIAPAHPLDERFDRAVFEDSGWGVIEQWRLDDGNRKRRGDDLRSLDRPERCCACCLPRWVNGDRGDEGSALMNPLALYSLSACLATMRRSTGPEAHTMGAFAQDAPEYRFRWKPIVVQAEVAAWRPGASGRSRSAPAEPRLERLVPSDNRAGASG